MDGGRHAASMQRRAGHALKCPFCPIGHRRRSSQRRAGAARRLRFRGRTRERAGGRAVARPTAKPQASPAGRAADNARPRPLREDAVRALDERALCRTVQNCAFSRRVAQLHAKLATEQSHSKPPENARGAPRMGFPHPRGDAQVTKQTHREDAIGLWIPCRCRATSHPGVTSDTIGASHPSGSTHHGA